MPASVLLPIPGEPPSRTSEPGTSPPPSTRSSSPIPVPSRSSRGDSTSRNGIDRGAPVRRLRAGATGAGGRGRGDHDLLERVPLRAARALTRPGQRLVAAFTTDVPAPLLRHHRRSCQARGRLRAPRHLKPAQPDRQGDQPGAEDHLAAAVKEALDLGQVVERILSAHHHVAGDPRHAGDAGPATERRSPLSASARNPAAKRPNMTIVSAIESNVSPPWIRSTAS